MILHLTGQDFVFLWWKTAQLFKFSKQAGNFASYRQVRISCLSWKSGKLCCLSAEQHFTIGGAHHSCARGKKFPEWHEISCLLCPFTTWSSAVSVAPRAHKQQCGSTQTWIQTSGFPFQGFTLSPRSGSSTKLFFPMCSDVWHIRRTQYTLLKPWTEGWMMDRWMDESPQWPTRRRIPYFSSCHYCHHQTASHTGKWPCWLCPFRKNLPDAAINTLSRPEAPYLWKKYTTSSS